MYPLVGGTTPNPVAGFPLALYYEFLRRGSPEPVVPDFGVAWGVIGGVPSSSLEAQVTGGGRTRGANWRGSCKDTQGRAGEIGTKPGKLGQEEPSQGVEERENRGGGGAAGTAETLGVTQASGTPRPLGSGWKEARETARRRRAVGMEILGWGWEQAGAASLGEPDLTPQTFPLLSKARRLGVMGKREGKLRHGLAETLLSWPTPFHSPGASLSRAPFFRAPHLNLPGRDPSSGDPASATHLGRGLAVRTAPRTVAPWTAG